MIEVELQRALYTRLSGASLGVQGVYDIAPQEPDGGDTSVFPYVVMGRVVMSQADTQTKIGHAAQIRIHTFSRTGSMLEAKAIQGAIFSALHKQVLTVPGYHNYAMLREDTDCFSGGGSTVHGVCEYRALIESA